MPSSDEHSEIIGHSTLGRALTVQFGVAQAGGPRIFIMAGQHGDESDARGAASQYLAGLKSRPAAGAHVAVLADANPDGAAVNTRRNARDVDLNRDHMLLSAPETAAIHSFVDRWNPDLVIDVHTYRPGRPELLQHGLVFPQDVMADIPTNPATQIENGFLQFLRERMAEAGIRYDRYTLVRPSGMVRHSNFDIIDARNGLALRFGIMTVLLEGRRSAPGDPAGFVPPHLALLRAIVSTVEWAGKNAARIGALPSLDLVPIGCEYARSGEMTRQMELMSAASGDIRLARIPGDYMPLVNVTGSIRLPRAYAVPCNSEIFELLKRHRLETASSDSECWRGASVEMHRMLSPLPILETEEPAPPPELGLERGPLNSADNVLFPTSQRGGRALALLLEPTSRFALYRFNDLHLNLRPGMLYPVARVI